MCSNYHNAKGQDKGSDYTLQLSLSDRTKQKGIIEDITINTKTKNVKVALNHGCKQTIISPIYRDWIKTANTIEKQAKKKGLGIEDTNIILDELDNNHDSILDSIFQDAKNDDSEGRQINGTKEVYLRKYSGNGKFLLCESIIVGGRPKFLQLTQDAKKEPKLLDKLEIGHKTFYPYDTLETHNPIPYTFESEEELKQYVERTRNETFDTLYLKTKSTFKQFVDVEEKYLVLLAASTMLSYYQDKFGTIHYIIIVGDNGSGKNSALLVYRYLGYRVFYVTAASAANIYTFLGDEEEGQGTLAEDEADNMHLQPDKYKIDKTGYASGGSVPKVDIHTSAGGRSQGVYLTFCMKWYAMEELPDYKQIKGQLDRSYVLKFVVGRPKYNIKDVIKNAGDHKFEPLYNQLLELRKLLMLKRLQNYNDIIYDVNLNISNRNAELTKPLIRLFRNSPRALSELLPVLSQFLKEKNEAKESSFESKLFEAVKKLIKNVGEAEQNKSTYEFSHEDLCAECRNVMDGNDIANKPQSFYTVDFGAVSHKKITETYRSKFKAKPHQTGGEDNKRCLIFSKEVLDRIELYYDNPAILSDDDNTEDNGYNNTDAATSTSTTSKEDSGGGSEEDGTVTDVTEITDYNDKQAVDNKQDIPLTSNQNDCSPEKHSVTDVTNITDPNYANAPDRPGAAGSNSKNIENNYNNIDIISNSYNNISNNYTIPSLPSPSNLPSSSTRCVISVTSVTKQKNDYTFGEQAINELQDLPTLSCLFCSKYKTKIRFDMDLHLYEKHKQNLVYDLPISDRKASIDDRMEYALQLIEQGKIILPNEGTEGEE
jgi:hypothetical protein